MTTNLLSAFDHTHPCPSLDTTLRTTTAIHRCLPDDLPPFDPPEIVWRRSPTGMALVQSIRFGESERVLLTLDQHWQLLRDPGHAMAAVLAEAELEYEALRPIEPWALVVQPQDASLGLSPGEEDCLRRGSHYSAAEIDELRMALRLTSEPPRLGMAALSRQLVPAARAEARAIVAAWDYYQAADIVALTRSGLAFWRRIAVAMGYDPMALEVTAALPICLQGCSGSIQSLSLGTS